MCYTSLMLVKSSLKTAVATGLILASLVGATGVNAGNLNTIVSSYTKSESTYNACFRYDTTFALKSTMVNQASFSNYNWNIDASTKTYNTCLNTLVLTTTWSDKGHNLTKDGVTSVYHTRTTSTSGDHDFTYVTSYSNGTVTVTQIWIDGVRVF